MHGILCSRYHSPEKPTVICVCNMMLQRNVLFQCWRQINYLRMFWNNDVFILMNMNKFKMLGGKTKRISDSLLLSCLSNRDVGLFTNGATDLWP